MMKVLLLALVAIACVAAVEFQQTEFAFGSEANVAPQQASSAPHVANTKRMGRRFGTVRTQITPATAAEKQARSSNYYYSDHHSGDCDHLAGQYTYKMVNHHGIFGVPLRFGPITINDAFGDMGIDLIDPTNAFDPFNGVYNLFTAASSVGVMNIARDCTFTAEGEVLYFAQAEYLPSLDTREQFRAGTAASECVVIAEGLYFETACPAAEAGSFGWMTMGCTITSDDSFQCVTSIFFGTADVAGMHHITAQRTFGSVRSAPAQKFDTAAEFDSSILRKFEGHPNLPPMHLHTHTNHSVDSIVNRVQVTAKTSGRTARDNHCSGIAGTFSYTAMTNIGAAGNFDYQLNRETAVSIGFATINSDCSFQIGGYNLEYFNPQDDQYAFAFGAELENCEVYRSSNKWFTVDCRCDTNPDLRDQLLTNQQGPTDGDYYTEFDFPNDLNAFFSREVNLCADNQLLTMRCLMNSRFDVDCIASAFLGEWSTKTSHDITMTRMRETSNDLMPTITNVLNPVEG